jgi:prepilin-type N-terminal cleavage/methylation domain-containing protein
MSVAERGTSLIEILIALTVLSVGVLGLAGTSTAVNRMLGNGRWSTVSLAYAERRLDLLRSGAVDSAGCAALAGGSGLLPGGLAEDWSVSLAPGVATVEVIISRPLHYPDTVTTVLTCR